MIPSESAIDRAIDGLAAGEFQQLVEAYARTAFPDRFARLSVHGRNPQRQTAAGWPDAYAVRADGRIDAIEATRDARNWRHHLGEDLVKAAKLPAPGLGGFLFVAWAAGPKPGVLADERRRLGQLGAAAADVTFTFRRDLVAALRSPEHAATWLQLGLTASAWPFVEISRAGLFGDMSPRLFAPTSEEIARGLVYLPSVAEAVIQRLDNQRWALVLGRGASGKTVLATTIGLPWESRGDPCYYIDLAPAGGAMATAGPGSALDAMASRAGGNVLFIIDNVHRDESLAAAIFEYWRGAGVGSRLLMLGRAADSEVELVGRRSALASLSDDAIGLSVGPDEIAGVWRRLTSRRATGPVVVPPTAVLRRWARLFGGDLIAFSAAMALREPEGPDWRLDATDASTYIETAYIAPLSNDQRLALLAVAEWSTLELTQPLTVADSAALQPSLRAGIVESVRDRSPGYRTIHPGIATLLVAAFRAAPYAEVVRELSRLNTEIALSVARRLAARGQRKLAEAALTSRAGTYAGVLRVLLAAGPTRVAEQVTLLCDVFGKSRLKEVAARPDETAAVVAQATPKEQLALLTQVRTMPGLRSAVAAAWPRISDVQQAQLGAAVARYTIEEDLKQLPIVLRRLDKGLPEASPSVLEAFVAQGGVELFFATPRRLPAGRWTDILRAAARSRVFRDRLIKVLGGQGAPIWPLLHVSDGVTLLLRIRAQDAGIAHALAEQIRRADFHRAAKSNALKTGPGPYLSLLRLAQSYDAALLKELLALAGSSHWKDAVSRWTRARTKFGRLKVWAAQYSSELAAAIQEAEPDVAPSA